MTTKWVRSWRLWQLPPSAVRSLLAVEAIAVAVLVSGLVTTPATGEDLLTVTVFVLCGIVGIEGSRRLDRPAGAEASPHRELLSAWTLPVALLLQPAWIVLAHIALLLVAQIRIGRAAPYLRVFTSAAMGLAGVVANIVFRDLAGGRPGDPAALVGSVPGFVALVVAGVLYAGVYRVIVGAATRVVVSPGSWLAARRAPWRDTWQLAWSERRGHSGSVLSDVSEICIGLTITLLWLVAPVALVFALPPVLLLQRALLHNDLQTAARTDAKTGLANPRYWRQTAERAIERSRRDADRLGVLLIDVDHFKRVNDTYGHLAGDVVLVAIADTLTAESRPADLAGRYGGEEFTLLLPGTDGPGALAVADRVRRRIADLRVVVWPDHPPVRVTVSVGVAALPGDGTDLDTLLRNADRALYAAKDAGRNRTRLAAAGGGPAANDLVNDAADDVVDDMPTAPPQRQRDRRAAPAPRRGAHDERVAGRS